MQVSLCAVLSVVFRAFPAGAVGGLGVVVLVD